MEAIFNDPEDLSSVTSTIKSGSNIVFLVSDLTLLAHFGFNYSKRNIAFLNDCDTLFHVVNFTSSELRQIVSIYRDNTTCCSLAVCSSIFYALQHHAFLITNEAIIVATAKKYNVQAMSLVLLKEQAKLITLKR